ncbi:MAG: hypothetical protein LUF33_03035 [Clostridiales bacterium]|nr:hypothetical protein [Clostridiales bacterium]
MNEEMLIAVLSFIGTLIGTLAGIFAASRLTNYRLEQLEKKVDKHNNLIERTYNIEGDINIIKEEMRTANDRIRELEKIEKEDKQSKSA